MHYTGCLGLVHWDDPRDGVGREEGGGFRMGNTCIPVADSFRYLAKPGNGNPLQYSRLENPGDGGAWWASVYGVAQSRTRLKRLSSSSSIYIPHGEQYTPEPVKLKDAYSLEGKL